MAQIIGHVGETLPEWIAWARQQPVRELLCSRYARGRRECYFGWGVTLAKSPDLYPAYSDSRVQALGDRWLPGWHSALFCEYPPGIGINPHRDHTCFAAEAVMLNLGVATFVEYPSREKVVTHLEPGVIVRLNTKILHAVRPVAETRYSLTFRCLKPAFQPTPETQLTLPLALQAETGLHDRPKM